MQQAGWLASGALKRLGAYYGAERAAGNAAMAQISIMQRKTEESLLDSATPLSKRAMDSLDPSLRQAALARQAADFGRVAGLQTLFLRLQDANEHNAAYKLPMLEQQYQQLVPEAGPFDQQHTPAQNFANLRQL